MKYILCSILPLFITISDQVPYSYNLLQDTLKVVSPDFVETTPGADRFDAYRFKITKPISVKIEKILTEDNFNLSFPIILSTFFKLDETNTTSCLFSIVDDRRVVKLELCFVPASRTMTRITIGSDSLQTGISFDIDDDIIMKDKWIKLLIQIEDRKSSVYIDCDDPYNPNMESSWEESAENIFISQDLNLNIGHSGAGPKFFFKGAVQDLNLYPNGDDAKKESLCAHTTLPLSSEGVETDHDDDTVLPKPEQLIGFEDRGLWTGGKSNKGEKGDKGDRGESVTGPSGPRGPEGPRGERGDIGSCECSEPVISNIIRTIPELKGPRGEPGAQGLKGEPGPPGKTEAFESTKAPVAGEKGDKGPIGPPGPVGFKGKQGEKGDNGEKGDEGQKGEKGDKGLQGNDGIRGEKGEAGQKGFPGEPGIPAPKAAKGSKGDVGEKGDAGSPGVPAKISSLLELSMDPVENATLTKIRRHYKGEKGDKGSTGDKGDKGLTGQLGQPGVDGNDGPPGKQGEIGLKGEIGPRGHKGESGEPGPPGNVPAETIELKKGPKGDLGHHGKKGEPGEKGDTGETGAKGDRGKTGPQGPIGPRGPEGKKGENGKDGADGLPGEQGLRGPLGDKGDKGDTGDQGIPGKSASLLSLLDPVIDLQDHDKIVNKLRGYIGDIGLKGDKGQKGDQGPTGSLGLPGKEGTAGVPGKDGLQGPEGKSGSKGPIGQKGEPGLPGNVPSEAIALTKGPKGERGEPGNIGSTGEAGSPGKTGLKGSKGVRGNPGPVGPLGPKGEKGSLGDKGQKGENATPFDYEMIKKEKGDKGDKGAPGDIGPAGSPGVPGSQLLVTGAPGSPGPPGPRGPPGISITGPKGEPCGIIDQRTHYTFTNDNSVNEEDFFTGTTIVFQTMRGLKQRTKLTPLGTLAYVLLEKTLLIRVEDGWQQIMLGPLLRINEPSTTTTSRPPAPMTTYRPPEIRPTRQTPPYSVDSSFGIRLVALDEPYSGSMINIDNKTGYSAAEHSCYRQSRRMGIAGTFTAFLATNFQDLNSVIKNGRYFPVVNLYGQRLFDSWLQIFNGSGGIFPEKANIYSFSGRNVLIDNKWPRKAIWHGSDIHGASKASCLEWQSNNAEQYGIASSIIRNKLLGQKRYSCNSKLIVLCIETKPPSSTFEGSRRQRHLHDRKMRFRRKYEQTQHQSMA